MALQLDNLRLPAWLLPANWPRQSGQPLRARLDLHEGRITRVQPANGQPSGLDCKGALALPGLVEPHAHLDKTYTRRRLGAIRPACWGPSKPPMPTVPCGAQTTCASAPAGRSSRPVAMA